MPTTISILSDPLLALPIAFGLALLLAVAALHKLRQPAAFAAVLDAYGVRQGGRAAAALRLLPVVEALLAVGLLTPATRRYCGLAVALLLLIYAGAMGHALVRGRRIADCGCGGSAKNPVSIALVRRNVVLSILACSLLQPTAVRQLGVYDCAVLALVLLMGAVAYALANTLIANQYPARDLFHD